MIRRFASYNRRIVFRGEKHTGRTERNVVGGLGRKSENERGHALLLRNVGEEIVTKACSSRTQIKNNCKYIRERRRKRRERRFVILRIIIYILYREELRVF